MNFCKCCGKEISEGRKFCNSSCAAKYNNKHRTRKPWTEEQRAKISDKGKEVRCCICGKSIQVKSYLKKDRFYCSKKCSSFSKDVNMLVNHFGFQKSVLGTDLVWSEYESVREKVRKLYEDDRTSSVDLAKKFGYRTSNVLTYTVLPRFGIKTRTVSEGVRLAVEKGLVTPPQGSYGKGCLHTSWFGQRFWLRSTYELDYAIQLDFLKVPYFVEYFRIPYFDTEKHIRRTAIPDFYLPETGEIVEIKSTFTLNRQNMRDKIRAYSEHGYGFKLILNKKEVRDVEKALLV